jgi:phage terminase small subunit
MKDFISKLLSNKVLEARNILDKRLTDLVFEKLDLKKVQLAEEMFGDVEYDVGFEEDELNESTVGSANVQKRGRTKVIRVRVRKGKVQRGKRFSAVKGYTIRGGRLVRMQPAEIRHRKLAAVRSKSKRRSKLPQTIRKRKISLRKRGSLGL